MKVILTVAVLFACYCLGVGQCYSCPPVNPDQAGICVQQCAGDEECDAPLKCCSNECGSVCTLLTVTPYHAPPYECPTPSNEVAGICSEECNETSCDPGYQCCSNGCGHTCMSICNLIEMKLANQTLIGVYKPQCEEDGRFSARQCHASTGHCWCVDSLSGKPSSDLHCSCPYNSEERALGEVFMSIDGFNSCTCTTAGVQCTDNKVFHSCPPVREDDEAGICVAECTLNSECPQDVHCCYTGCGYSCMTPEVIPYIPLPTLATCPPTSAVPCVLDEGSCDVDTSSDSDCDDGVSLCCENNCGGAVCVSPTGSTPCRDARRMAQERNETQDSMVGRFAPQCDTDGRFRPIQCHEHYCWCVHTLTGEPESDMVAFEHLDNLECTSCVYDGLKYDFLAQFPAEDGCNTCTCVYDGVVSCSEVGCEEPEEEESVLWDWWHKVLIYCVVAVIVLTVLVLVLLLAVVYTIKKNKFRHRRLKEAATAHFESDMDAVYFKNGQDLTTVELKVPVEDADQPDQPSA